MTKYQLAKTNVLTSYSQIEKTSLESLIAYRNKINGLINNDVSKRANENVITTLTFSRPLTINEFEQLIKDYEIIVDHFSIRAINTNSEKVTIGGRLNKTGIVPMNVLNEMLEESDAELRGVIDCYCKIGTVSLKKISNDSKVFLADITADNSQMSNEFNYYIPSLYWYIEKFK